MTQLNNVYAIFENTEDPTSPILEDILFLDDEHDIMAMSVYGYLELITTTNNFIGVLHSKKKPNSIEIANFIKKYNKKK